MILITFLYFYLVSGRWGPVPHDFPQSVRLLFSVLLGVLHLFLFLSCFQCAPFVAAPSWRFSLVNSPVDLTVS